MSAEKAEPPPQTPVATDGFATLVRRNQWGANPEKPPADLLKPLGRPLESLVATWTETRPCKEMEECKRTVRELQQHHIELGLPDIRHHFMVGEDGCIYEGRGLDWQAPEYPSTVQDHELLSGKSVEVAFINLSIKPATEKQLKSFSSIVTLCQEMGVLGARFKFYSGPIDFIDYYNTFDPVNDLEQMIQKQHPPVRTSVLK